MLPIDPFLLGIYSVHPMNELDREEALTLGILEAIEEGNDVTQRRLARRLDVALGLANSYLKRCARKGLIKIQQAPANRYLYYLTPQGFAEKGRLTARYLSYSFSFYRQAGESCTQLFSQCRSQGWNRVLLCGASELAEIASLRALEAGVEVVGILDRSSREERFLGHEVKDSIEACGNFHACVLTELSEPQESLCYLADRVPSGRILVPGILGIKQESQVMQ